MLLNQQKRKPMLGVGKEFSCGVTMRLIDLARVRLNFP